MMNHSYRKSPRLIEYDYSQNGAYFITICQQNRLHLFGSVIDGQMQINAAGEMLITYWNELHNKYPVVAVEDFGVMPNHVHGVIVIEYSPTQEQNISLSTIIQWFKIMTTNAYMRGVKELAWFGFDGKLWQRSFHDHIIRNEQEYLTIRQYIKDNPARWLEDRFYNYPA